MPKIRQNYDVLHALDCRERLLKIPSPYRLNLKILRQLIIQKDSTFTKLWDAQSKQPITCEDGKLYFHNFSTCLTLCGMNSLPSTLYKLGLNSSDVKILDALVYSGPVSQFPKKPDSHKPFFLALTVRNFLHLYDNFTGKLIEKVFLGPHTRYKYRHVDWDTHGESVTVQTVRNIIPAGNQENRPRVVVTIATFSVHPLEFEALVEIDRDVFGKDCNHVNVSEGLLIVGTGSAVSGTVRLYNFRQVIKEGMMYSAKLYEKCEYLDGERVGCFPGGIPLNCKVRKAPPILFEVKCSEYTLHIGGYPWHYITTPPRKEGVFEVRSLPGRQSVKDGYLDFPSECIEPDSIAFLPDDSGRIVYNSSHSVKFFKLVGQEGNMKMEECFELGFGGKELIPLVHKSGRARRQVRNNNIAYAHLLRTCEKSIVSDDYENEMDIYAVLGFDPDDSNCAGKIMLADNQTGQMLKVIDLNLKIDEFSDYTLTMDLETLIILVRNRLHQFNCFVYRLSSKLLEEEMQSASNVKKSAQTKPKKQKQRR